ncbi:hypothetical protein ACET3Z_023209 [Daucus carota]
MATWEQNKWLREQREEEFIGACIMTAASPDTTEGSKDGLTIVTAAARYIIRADTVAMHHKTLKYRTR